jgi:hypothetical protein
MNSPDQGFSIEGSITTAVGLLLLLIRPEQPVWRIVLLALAGSLFLNVVRKSQWAKRSNPILTLTGESFADDDDTFMRKLRAYALIIFVIAAFGFVTWPENPTAIPGDGVLFYSSATSQIQFQTPKGILPNKPDAQPGTETKQATGPILGAPVKGVKLATHPPAPPTDLRVARVPNSPNAVSATAH